MRKLILISTLLVAFLLTTSVVGCQSQATQAPPAATTAPSSGLTLKISGKVGQELTLSEDDLAAYEQVEVTTELKDETVTFTGVRINDLLSAAGAEGETLSLVADDGYTGEVKLADIAGCDECIVAIEKDMLRAVLPGQPTKVWVKNLVELRID